MFSALKCTLMTGVGSVLVVSYPMCIFLVDETVWACYLLLFLSFCTKGTKEKGIWLVCIVVCWVCAVSAAVAVIILQAKPPSNYLLFAEGASSFLWQQYALDHYSTCFTK